MTNKMHKHLGLAIRGLLLLLIFGTVLSAKSEEIKGSFGQLCNETEFCNSTQSLNCFNGVCYCNDPKSLIFDNELSTCVVQANKTCIIQNSVSLTLTEPVSLQAPGTHNLPCVKNSNCDPTSKLCVCDKFFMPSENGSCVAKLLFGEKCSTSSECREDLGLVCDKDVCMCDPNNTTDEQAPDGCVGQAEKPCIYDKCTEHASCVEADEWFLDLKDERENGTFFNHANNTSMKTPTYTLNETRKICQCNDNYNPTKSGKCAKDYDIKCDGDRGCKSWFKCGDSGACECHHPTLQVFDKRKEACVSMVNGPCNSNLPMSFEAGEEFNVGCVSGAECVLKSSQGHTLNQTAVKDGVLEFDSLVMIGSCSCRKGYFENKYGGCDLGYGMECSTDDDHEIAVDHVLISQCHDLRGMGCFDNKCQCEDVLSLYDEEEKICVISVGSHCLEFDYGMSKNVGEAQYLPKCTKNAVCVYNDNGGADGICKCVTREIGGGKCGTYNIPIMIIAIVAGASVLVIVIAIVLYVFVKRQGFLAKLLM